MVRRLSSLNLGTISLTQRTDWARGAWSGMPQMANIGQEEIKPVQPAYRLLWSTAVSCEGLVRIKISRARKWGAASGHGAPVIPFREGGAARQSRKCRRRSRSNRLTWVGWEGSQRAGSPLWGQAGAISKDDAASRRWRVRS